MSAPEAVRPVTLWRYSEPGCHSYQYIEGDHLDTDAEYRALPAAQYAALVAERDALKSSLTYIVNMFTPGHRGPCDAAKVDAAGCLAGLECEIDAVVEAARSALGAERGEA